MSPLITKGMAMSKMVCKDCGSVGETATETRGSFAIEVVAWLCFLVPGLIYSLWRLSIRHETCAACGSAKVLPLDSPTGRQLALSAGHEPEPPRQPSSAAVGLGRSLGQLAGRLKK